MIRLWIILLAGLALPALADVHMQYEVSGDSQAVSDIMIANGKLRINQHDSENWTLFDSVRSEMVIVDAGKREYLVLDQATIEQLTNVTAMVEQKMEEALEDVPPAQREQMRSMMEGMMSNAMEQAKANIPEQTVKRTGQSRTVAGYDCTVVEILLDGVKSMETCGADPRTVDLPRVDLQTMRAMQTFAQDIAARTESILGEGLINLGDLSLDDFPIETVHFEDGSERARSTLAGIDDDSLDAELFEIPGDYKQQEIELPEL